MEAQAMRKMIEDFLLEVVDEREEAEAAAETGTPRTAEMASSCR
jgi:hypothetical protein